MRIRYMQKQKRLYFMLSHLNEEIIAVPASMYDTLKHITLPCQHHFLRN